ncbi:hypothetical protein ABZX75_24955 [Streptomyces sp. NPDC003038]|uniref:hypothetical protein n=1 Tax=unclassified Streptomyces TaxID=2593676 RepID=UPI0033BCF586
MDILPHEISVPTAERICLVRLAAEDRETPIGRTGFVPSLKSCTDAWRHCVCSGANPAVVMQRITSEGISAR